MSHILNKASPTILKSISCHLQSQSTAMASCRCPMGLRLMTVSAARKVSTTPTPTATEPSMSMMSGSRSRNREPINFNRIPPAPEQILDLQSSPPFAVNLTSPAMMFPLISPSPQMELNVALENLNSLFSRCEVEEWPLGITNDQHH